MKWFLSTLLVLAGLVLGHYYHLITNKVKDPTSYSTSKQLILSDELLKQAPLGIVTPDGTQVTGNVYSETVVFFNQGNGAIKPEDVLEPVSICLSDTTGEIIDFKVLKVSRPVIGLELARDSLSKSEINVDFRILENEDGFHAQIIYASTSQSALRIHGAIEGAPKGFSNSYKGKFLSFKKLKFSTFFAGLLLGVILGALGLLLKYAFKKEPLSAPDFQIEDSPSEKRGVSSAFTTKYKLIIRNANSFRERTTLTFTYSQLILASFMFFLTVFVLSTFLMELIFETSTTSIPQAVDVPETLLINL